MTPSSRRGAPERFVPLKPVIAEILMALADRPLHGYALLSEVRERSGGRVRLQTGPLYRHLRRLLDDGLVGEVEDPSHDGDADDRRRTYALTALGRDVLALEGERLATIVDRGRALGVIPS